MSPKVKKIGPYSFHFYMYDCRERMHIHVYRGKRPGSKTAKVWLETPVELAWNKGFSSAEISQILLHVRDNLEFFRSVWKARCGEADDRSS